MHDELLKRAAHLMASRYEYLWLAPATRSQLIEDVRIALHAAKNDVFVENEKQAKILNIARRALGGLEAKIITEEEAENLILARAQTILEAKSRSSSYRLEDWADMNKYKAWREKHEAETQHPAGEMDLMFGDPSKKTVGHLTQYGGAIGGGLTYCFTPTSIGVAVSVRCEICDVEENISDYDKW